jgi:amino acid adenylation domain-containing protein/non-ribosomal peptide synthase protein (TIGR01720 family)
MKNIEDFYPLSPMQQGILFHSLYAPDSGVYCELLSCNIQGQLNVSVFQQAWQQLLKRHPVLRTSFVWEGLKEPAQVVHKQVTLPWEQQDWREMASCIQQERIETFLITEQKQGFKIAQAPLMRLTLIQLADNNYQFIWSHHHLLLDGWSSSLLLDEVFAFYKAFSQGQDLHLKQPRLYRDYIAWLQQQDLSQSKTFWRQHLQNFTATTSLSIDRASSRSLSEDKEYQQQQFQLSTVETLALQSLARQQQLTVNALIQGAWAILLNRYSGENDVIFGAVVSGRGGLEGTESTIGVLINTLPVRVRVNSEESLIPWLKRLQAQQNETRLYEQCPLIEIQKWSDMHHGQPLFESILNFQNYPINFSKEQQIGNLKISDVRNFIHPHYPLTVSVKVDSEFLLEIFYQSCRFDTDAISRMLGHFQTLLKCIVVNPQQHIGDLSLLSEPERHQLLVEWIDTQAEYPQNCIHELFEAQVAITPDAVAVVFEEEQLTYRELNERANQLGHYLRYLGVKPEVLVGICTERSLEMVIGVLAIMKAGGAYVPLDPSYPTERLAFMLANSQPKVLLTQQHVLKNLPTHQASLVCLDTEWEIIAQQSTQNLGCNITVDNLVYVIYTSGSTGQPKGAMNTHKGICNRLVWMQNTYQLKATDSVVQKTPFSFDVSVWEFFWPLMTGARLVVAQPQGHQDPNYLVKLIAQEQITTIHFVPSMLQAFAEAEGLEKCHSLKRVMASGEALPVQLQQQFFQRLSAQLHNLYGPTEAAVDVTFWECKKQSSTQEHGVYQNTVPIGHPIANTQIYLLDKNFHPVPVGVTGELYIGGVGVGRGYFNRPELTAEKFIPNPFSNQPGTRLYKTGDLARYRPNGAIEYIGRIDHQVKIRGFRIELGEIEAILCQHPAVREAVVAVHSSEIDSQRIVAYVVTNSKQMPTIAELRGFLELKLPNYMVPTAFVILEALPLTPNGKVDRKALPAPDLAQLSSLSGYTAPSTPTEEMLAGIWAEVLAIEKIGIHSNFFELGGHSLLATCVISQIRKVFQVELPLRCLFEKPTIAKLAKEIEKAIKVGLGVEKTNINRISRLQEFPLSLAQQRLWFLAQLEPDNPFYNMASAIHVQGKLNFMVLQESFNEVVRRHEILRTNFRTVDSRAVAIIASAKSLSLPLLDISEVPSNQREIKVRQLVLAEAQQPFDLNSDMLVRVKLLRLDEQEHIVLLTMHHIVSDGWSMGLLVRELGTIYQALCNEQPLILPNLPIQYVDFAVWQRDHLQGEVLNLQLAYWKQQLGGSLPVLQLPTDNPRPTVQSYKGGTHSFTLSKSLTKALKVLSQQAEATLFMTLLAAFKSLIYRYTQEDDLIVGTAIANRNLPEIENLIGFFVNTLVLRTDMSGNPSFLDLLGRVRKMALDAYNHQDLPFDKLVEEIHPERNLSHNPLFQVWFALNNSPMPRLEIGELTLTILQTDSATAQFDLSLDIVEYQEELIGTLEYNTDLFDAGTITRMLGHFHTLLEGIVASPQQPIYELPLLTTTERHQLLYEWNNTQADYPHKCIHQLFEAQVERTPDAVAVVFEEQQLTYRELNSRANQLAHYLQALGVEPEVLVGICTERSCEMVVGLLGILKAGGAYMPLDPQLPEERLSLMLKESQVAVLLTTEKLIAQLPEHQAQVVCLDRDWRIISLESEENPVSGVQASHLVYVIYTSGSTGKPKGVMIQHQALVNFTETVRIEYALNERDRVLQFASISFDAAAEEIYPCLTCGGMLVLRNDEMLSSVPGFLQKCRELDLTALDLPTAYWHQLISELVNFNLELPESLRLVIIGGEQALREKVKMWQDRIGTIPELINTYGPTEATVVTTLCKLSSLASAELHLQQMPIGRPIRNVQVYLLDQYLQPVPVGVPGELYIGGAPLAKGYLNSPELTQEKFIPNPFSQKQGARLYKTGDLARYLADGNIEYLRRSDHQVKIRGFRIELGEIEAVLSQHPNVLQTVVIVRDDVPGDKRLVAYLVVKQQPSPTISHLRHYLTQKLPEYMVPTAFVFLDTMPLTPSGKLDRRSLPAPERIRSELEETYIAPQTIIEKELAAIWAQVLGLKKIGINDNFFELGGDSILSLQVISKANQAGLNFTLKQLFQHQTIAQLATVTGTNISISAEQGLVNGTFFLIPIQRWFFEENFSNIHHYNQSVLLEVEPTFNPVFLEQAVQFLQQHHDLLRSQFIQESFRWKSTITELEQIAPFMVVDLSALLPESQKDAITATCNQLQTSLNLFSGQLLRVALFNLGANQHSRLFVVIHHLVVDGVSWRVLLEDLQTAYTQLSRREKIKLPPKTTSFKQWAYKLQEYAQSATVQQEMDYWLQILRQPCSCIPVDYPDGDNTMGSADSVKVTLSQEETQALLQDVPAAFRTQINDVLLAALLQAFAQYTGKNSLLLHLEGHGREELFSDIDISRTVGWFTTVFPVRLSVDKTTNLAEMLKTLKEQLRQIPNRGIGYGLLYYCNKNREITEVLRSLPKAEVSFNYLGQFDQALNTSSIFKLAPEPQGLEQSARNHRSYLLEIDGAIVSGQLQLQWRYSKNLHKQSTVEILAQEFIVALRSIITYCQSQESVDFTPSDFPLAQLSQSELDLALQQISF